MPNSLKIKFLIIFLFSNYVAVLAQSDFTVSGTVTDGQTKKPLIGAIVAVEDTNKRVLKGEATNESGFFTLSLPAGNYVLTVNYVGYLESSKPISLKSSITQKIELQPNALLDEVVISGDKADRNVMSADVGKIGMKIETIKSLPAMFGEIDIMKSLQLLPGIQTSGEGNTGFYVRGGGADQNLILLDDAPVYNAGHLFGFFSVFNTDAIAGIDVFKSGMPAYYGGRLASILDVTQKEGDMQKIRGEGGIGLIFSRLALEGPIVKDKLSFLIAGRTTYADLLIQPFLKNDSPLKGVRLYFYDVNAKLTAVINPKNRLYFSAYFGNDGYGFKSQSGSTSARFQWGNGLAVAKWNSIITPEISLNTSFLFSNYEFQTTMKQDVYNFQVSSGVRDYGAKTELSYLPKKIPHIFRFGIHYIYHEFSPNKFEVNAGEANLNMGNSQPYLAHDLAVYAHDEFDLGKAIRINLGVRYTHFAHIGKFTRYITDSLTSAVVDSINYKRGEVIKPYNRVEPRFSIRFLVDSSTSIKASFTMNYQYIHQVSMASISLPTDVWMPSTSLIKPQYGTQYTLGVFRNWKDNSWETYIDFYYKDLKNLVEYKDGEGFNADFQSNPDASYCFGNGTSYGVEFFVKKAVGRFTGFVGYTLSYSQRQFPNLNKGKPFYAKYDRRHDVSISLSYEILRNKLSASAVWVFASGNAITLPANYYFINGNYVIEYAERNSYRVEPYHRLDLSLNWTIKKTSKFETGLNFSVYNVYNRKNPFVIFFENTMDFSSLDNFEMSSKAIQMSLFPIIPSITWNFKF